MKQNRLFAGLTVLLLLLLIGFALVQTGCANIIPPLGGPKDTIPPVLISAKPVDSATNFKTNRIVLTFDEYVEIMEVQKNLIVSPTPKVSPNVDRKLNTITIKLRDTLEPNTTYTLNFGNSIRDLNEGNIFKNFTYIFSTGNYFDSLQFSGKVLLAKGGGVDTTITVLLHRNLDDSAIVKEKPRYIARVDVDGNFHFRNLPSGIFALYAMKDEGSSFRFSGRDQVFAFADHPVKIEGHHDTTGVVLYAFPDNEGASTSAPTRARGGQASKEKRLIVTTNLVNQQQDLLNDLLIYFDTPLKTFDTTKISFMDSTFTQVPEYRLIMDSTKKQVRLKTTWKDGMAYHLLLDKEFGVDTLGKKLLRMDSINFKTKGLNDYGVLKIKFPNLDMSKNPVLMFMQGDNAVDSAVLTKPEFNSKMFNPGEYQLRILYDENKNGRWDPGQFFGIRKQPEMIRTIDLKISVKPNWDNDFERDINALPAKKNGQPATNSTSPKRVTGSSSSGNQGQRQQ